MYTVAGVENVLLVDFVVKEPFVQLESQSDGPHYTEVKPVAGLVRVFESAMVIPTCNDNSHMEEVQHCLLEAGHVALPWPHVLPRRVPVAPDFHRLLAVRGLRAQCGDLLGVG